MRKSHRIKKCISAILLLMLMLSSSLTADAHPGRTDRYGGHYNRKTGEYHYHNSGYSGSTKKSTTRKKATTPKSTKSTTTKQSTSTSKKSSPAVSTKPSDPETALANADVKLKDNNFLLVDEIARIYAEEQTPDVMSKLTDAQVRVIKESYNAAKSGNTQRSQGFGATITDPLEKSYYQAGVLRNMMLKACREIAQRYGIKAGDVNAIVTKE